MLRKNVITRRARIWILVILLKVAARASPGRAPIIFEIPDFMSKEDADALKQTLSNIYVRRMKEATKEAMKGSEALEA